MKIIRDTTNGGIMMLPLLLDWGIRRCNVDGCGERPNTIIQHDDPGVIFGLCEQHYQQGKKPGGTAYSLVFDGFSEENEE